MFATRFIINEETAQTFTVGGEGSLTGILCLCVLLSPHNYKKDDSSYFNFISFAEWRQRDGKKTELEKEM